jgi:hypothetical protein
VLISKLSGGKRISRTAGAGLKEVLIEGIDPEFFQEILATLAEGRKENKTAFKVAKVWCYGPALSTVQILSGQMEHRPT